MSGGKLASGVFSQGGANVPMWMNNLSIVRATTTGAGDSVKITSADGTALSPINYGWITLPDPSNPGRLVRFSVTADVTILISGITPNGNGTGDLSGAILRILAINDSGTLKWGVAYLGGRTTLLTTDTTATPASVTDYEDVLCNSAIGSATNSCIEIGYVRADFTDATNIWAIQSGVNDVVTGGDADGIWREWKTQMSGFSVDPTLTCFWTQIKRNIFIRTARSAGGTSNATDFSLNGPCKARYLLQTCFNGTFVNNGVVSATPGMAMLAAGDDAITLFRDWDGLVWTNSGTKYANVNFMYEVGPAASFID